MRITGILAGLLIAGSVAAQPAPDYARAKDLYKAAEAAMAAGQFGDAATNYGAVYDITKDPVLFYKLGSANEKAGRCDVALTFYRRYLDEAKPSEKFVAQTKERIAACGGTPPSPPSAPAGGPPTPPVPGPATTPTAAPDLGAGSAAPLPPGPPPAKPGHHQAAWLCVSGSIAFATVGAVLAYSANAAENDVADLYVGLGGHPPAYNTRTRSQYEALQRDGRRYEVMSWMSFGVAGLAAVAAASLFYGDRHEQARHPMITPTVSSDGGGVAATMQF